MTRELFREKSLKQSFKDRFFTDGTEPVDKKRFIVILMMTLAEIVLAYLICMKIHTNEVTNAIYVMFVLQIFGTGLVIVGGVMCMFSAVFVTNDFVSRLDFDKTSGWIKAIDLAGTVSGWIYIATLFTTNNTLILVLSIFLKAFSYMMGLITQEVMTIAANKMTEKDFNQIEEMKETRKKENDQNS